MKSTMRILVSLVMAGASLAAFAADDFDFKIANIDVLRDKNVQKDVGISDAQRAKMNTYASSYETTMKNKVAEYQKAKKTPDQAFATFGQTQMTSLRTNVLNVLSASQLTRLREITLQAAGPRALMDKIVATKCGMSATEYNSLISAIRTGDQKISTIKSQVAAKVREKYKNEKKPTNQKEMDALNARVNKDLNAEMKKHEAEMKQIITTSEQKTNSIVKQSYKDALKKLCGRPFTPPAQAKPGTGKPSGTKPAGKKG